MLSAGMGSRARNWSWPRGIDSSRTEEIRPLTESALLYRSLSDRGGQIDQYRQLFRSAPGGAVFWICSKILGRYCVL